MVIWEIIHFSHVWSDQISYHLCGSIKQNAGVPKNIRNEKKSWFLFLITYFEYSKRMVYFCDFLNSGWIVSLLFQIPYIFWDFLNSGWFLSLLHFLQVSLISNIPNEWYIFWDFLNSGSDNKHLTISPGAEAKTPSAEVAELLETAFVVLN